MIRGSAGNQHPCESGSESQSQNSAESQSESSHGSECDLGNEEPQAPHTGDNMQADTHQSDPVIHPQGSSRVDGGTLR